MASINGFNLPTERLAGCTLSLGRTPFVVSLLNETIGTLAMGDSVANAGRLGEIYPA